jgi:hypothetical protein
VDSDATTTLVPVEVSMAATIWVARTPESWASEMVCTTAAELAAGATTVVAMLIPNERRRVLVMEVTLTLRTGTPATLAMASR